MKAGGVDPGLGVTRTDLAGSNIRCGIDRKVDRDRQFGQVNSIAFDHQFLPWCAVDALDRPVVLAAFAKTRSKCSGLDPHGGGEQPAIAGDVGDDRRIEAFDPLEDDDRAAAGTLEFEDGRGDVEFTPDRFADAH